MSQRKKVLIVEDERIFAEDLANVLQDSGYEVVGIAISGEAALELMAKFQPDIVLLDVKLTGEMDGIELGETIRKKWDLPIIYITAYADEELIKRAKKTEPLGFIQKPFRTVELIHILEIALHKYETEKRVKRQRAWISEILDNIKSGVLVVSSENRIIFVNANFCRLLRRKEKDLLGREVDDILKINRCYDGQKEEINFKQLYSIIEEAETTQEEPLTLQLIGPEDKAIYVEIQYSRIINPSDETINHLYLVHDVDKEIRYKLALEKERRKLLYIFRVAEGISKSLEETLIMEKVASAIVEYCRAANCLIYIQNEQGVYERRFAFDKKIEREIQIQIEKLVLSISECNKSIITSGELYHRDERYADLRLIGIPLISRNNLYCVIVCYGYLTHGMQIGNLGLLLLLSNFITTAFENAKLYKNLQVSYQMLKKSQDKYIRSERMRALGEMASGIAHNFNNSLAVILNNLEIITREQFKDNLDDILDEIKRVTIEAAGTVKKLLKYTQREPSKAQISGYPLKTLIENVLQDTRNKWRTEPKSKGLEINLSLDLDPDLQVEVDQDDFREVVTNVLFNAVEALTAGGKIEIKAWRDNQEVRLEIRDTGVGIPGEHLERVFDPFFTTKLQHGAGLGLSVAQKLIKNMDGRIEIKSQPGEGTTVTIILPEGMSRKEVKPEKDMDQEERKELTILLVDDEAPVLRSFSRILKVMGHKVEAAKSGKEALELFKKKDFDLVITDLGMSGMNGYELARKVKKHKINTPVILLTGWDTEKVSKMGKTSEVDHVLMKPCSMSDISEAINQVMD